MTDKTTDPLPLPYRYDGAGIIYAADGQPVVSEWIVDDATARFVVVASNLHHEFIRASRAVLSATNPMDRDAALRELTHVLWKAENS